MSSLELFAVVIKFCFSECLSFKRRQHLLIMFPLRISFTVCLCGLYFMVYTGIIKCFFSLVNNNVFQTQMLVKHFPNFSERARVE